MTDLKRIWPSLLAANQAKLGSEAQLIVDYGCGGAHLDVMDGHFVPQLSMGPKLGKDLAAVVPGLVHEVHLMTNPVNEHIYTAAVSQAETVIIHSELSGEDLRRSLMIIKDNGVRVGLALNPGTSLAGLENTLDLVDQVLIMLVTPGRTGQSMINNSKRRVANVIDYVQRYNSKIEFALDGGINAQTITDFLEFPIARFVVGAGFFHGDVADNVKKLRASLASVG